MNETQREFEEIIDRYADRIMKAPHIHGKAEIKVILCQFAREQVTLIDKIKSRISNSIEKLLRD